MFTDASELADLREQIRDVCHENGLYGPTLSRLVIAVDEATANILEHSDRDQARPIGISIRFNSDSVAAEITDDGAEFDPTAQITYEPSDKCRSKRGFGLYLIKVMADEIDYRRVGNTNYLRLTVPKT